MISVERNSQIATVPGDMGSAITQGHCPFSPCPAHGEEPVTPPPYTSTSSRSVLDASQKLGTASRPTRPMATSE